MSKVKYRVREYNPTSAQQNLDKLADRQQRGVIDSQGDNR
jgi:hypothetical protein